MGDHGGEAEAPNKEEECRVPEAEVQKHVVEVIRGVWLGDRYAAADRELLQKRNILAVVNCASAPPDKDVDWARVAAKFGFVVPCFHVEPHGEQEPLQYMLVHVKDEAAEPISDYFDESFTFIEGALHSSKSVLIHCEAGRSRSATVLLAYLMKSQRLSLSEALSKIKLQNRAVFPNDGFISQLHQYAETIGVKSALQDYIIKDENELSPDEAIEKNMKTCAWRLEQGAWFTTPESEVTLLQKTGYVLEDCVALGTLIALEKDSMVRTRIMEVFDFLFSRDLVSTERISEAYRTYLLEDPAETEFPILEDLKLDVPFADQYAGQFLYCAQVNGKLSPEFNDYISSKYPKVYQHMAESIQSGEQK